MLTRWMCKNGGGGRGWYGVEKLLIVEICHFIFIILGKLYGVDNLNSFN